MVLAGIDTTDRGKMNLEDLGLEDGEIVEQAKQKVQDGKNLIPWLEDPHECDNCGAYCNATREFVDTTAWVGPTDIWKCPECNSRFFRDRI